MQETAIIQAGDPRDLKAAIDLIIAGGGVITIVTETVKSFYLVVYTA